MMRCNVRPIGAAVACLVAMAAQGAPTSQPVRPDSLPKTMLYDQSTGSLASGFLSQNFETSKDIMDCQGADDFVVPAGETWRVHRVRVEGGYFNGSPDAKMRSMHVAFYRDASGQPGELVMEGDFPFVEVRPGTGWAQVKPVPVLPSGTYWLSVAANLDGAVGSWAWFFRNQTANGPSMWRNPGNGFQTGCTAWTPESTCLNVGQGDKMFQLMGRRALP